METVAYHRLPVDLSEVRYDYGPDSFRRSLVAQGETVEIKFSASKVFPGTTRRVWVHVPAGVDQATPSPFVVFQDGWLNVNPAGEVRAGIVLDNLVHAGELPPMVGIFVDPGVFPGVDDPDARKNRNAEYDAFDDRYAQLITTEVLPIVSQDWALTSDPHETAIVGGSSGGCCAFTTAWMRPDRFGKVAGFLSSFVQVGDHLPDGNPYPDLIRSTPRRDTRVFLQAGHRDLNWDQPTRNWLAENLKVAAALAEAGYDVRLILTDSGHVMHTAGVLLPDALRWLWRKERSFES
ncbi:MAG: alpha/beta hydrolase-fold protein [Actinomycetota bacterium]|nr:alpha/beta hydrolase-fold protein [Actinomycetota bacterium]